MLEVARETPGQVHISSLCVVEVHSASVRLAREGRLSAGGLDAICQRLAADLAAGLYRVYPSNQAWAERAARILLEVGRHVPLRSLDALHLAAVLAIREVAPDLVLVTADGRLIAAAEATGLPTLDPTRE